MKERLVQLLDLEQISPSKFADIIGVQRSSISHVISGRNKPSFDFLQKTLKAFPGLNAEWLILGQGTMYEQMGRGGSGNLFDSPVSPPESSFPEDIPGVEQHMGHTDDLLPPVDAFDSVIEAEPVQGASEVPPSGVSAEADTTRRVIQVMVFYDDDTFKTFKPTQ